MDVILRNGRIENIDSCLVDVGIEDGKIAFIGPHLDAEGTEIHVDGRLITSSFVESHLHLDKSCILDRCKSERGDLQEAIQEVSSAKKDFTPEDIYERAKKTLEQCILQGTGHIRTQLEVDPVIELRALEGLLPLIKEYRWAVDVEICVFPQEGLLNNPGTIDLITSALANGATLVGAAPYTDTDPKGQIDHIFQVAREYDVDIDMHLDFAHHTESFDLDYVCRLTDKYGYGGRVAIGHVTKLSFVDVPTFVEKARRLANSGVAVSVLPSTDLFLMGRHQEHSIPRGVTPAHKLCQQGVNCSLATNNVLNPFTPFGDCSPIRIANLYANVCQVGSELDLVECYEMITQRAARLMRIEGYGVKIGNRADLVVLDCQSRVQAISQLSPVLWGFKNGRLTFTRSPAKLHNPVNQSSKVDTP
ncbi:amidohydrolase family protein [SAR202 cluster bacterium AD-804-J14_MRT_500m]|nr:amidohydrolase family protein [SAR202 cluster bacterium AD-804-J14_MRT_500m]